MSFFHFFLTNKKGGKIFCDIYENFSHSGHKILSTKPVDNSADNFAPFGFFRLFWQTSMDCLFFRHIFKPLILNVIFLFTAQIFVFIRKIFFIVTVP